MNHSGKLHPSTAQLYSQSPFQNITRMRNLNRDSSLGTESGYGTNYSRCNERGLLAIVYTIDLKTESKPDLRWIANAGSNGSLLVNTCMSGSTAKVRMKLQKEGSIRKSERGGGKKTQCR